MNTITISKAENKKNLYMLMRIYLLLGSTTGEFESHLMGSWEGSLNRLYEK